MVKLEHALLGAHICIDSSFKRSVSCHKQEIQPADCPQIAQLPDTLNTVTHLETVLSTIGGLKVCEGNADEKFTCLSEARKGVFMNQYKVKNPYALDRYLYFLSDPPHLLKTPRNCLASKARRLWVI